MRSRIQAVVLPPEPTEFRDDARRIFQELDRIRGEETITGECVPPLDVFETDEAVEIDLFRTHVGSPGAAIGAAFSESCVATG